jgi:hypothetical protein
MIERNERITTCLVKAIPPMVTFGVVYRVSKIFMETRYALEMSVAATLMSYCICAYIIDRVLATFPPLPERTVHYAPVPVYEGA